MNTLTITVVHKMATYHQRCGDIICGNSDYQIEFLFDEDWAEHDKKTARFIWNGTHQDVVFTGTVCKVPVINDARMVTVGVFAGDLHTTTPARITAEKSILCSSGRPAAPSADVYAQIMDSLNRLTARVEALEQGGYNPNPSTAILGVATLGSLKLA